MGEFPVLDGQLFLFQGDSITDCGRRGPAAPLGSGYASMFVERVTAAYPERTIRYLNKGIGGDRVTGLRDRWEDDVLRHRPDWVSILIGINDLHSVLRKAEPCVPVELYREAYEEIIVRTQERLNAKIVVMDPFYISIDAGGHSFRSMVLELLPQYIGVVHELAAKYGTYHVKTHELFQEHLKYRDAETFCPEPVHPNHTGHMILADALLRALQEP
jgi:lysophospholipase L1-like esterase